MELIKTEENFCSANDAYMNEEQLTYFKNKLILQKIHLIEKLNEQKSRMKALSQSQADLLDRSNSLMEFDRQAKDQERNTNRIQQIDAALDRIEKGDFGYCELTGRRIGLKRLEAMPFTSMSIEALRKMETWQ